MMKEKTYLVVYKPFVTIKGKKFYTENVELQLPAKNKKMAMKSAIATLQEQGFKYAKTNRKYIKLKKVI